MTWDLELRCVWTGLHWFPVDLTVHYVVRSRQVVKMNSFAPLEGIPLNLIHPLQTCCAFGMRVPCVRDPVGFLSLWRKNKYMVDKWCLALPWWHYSERPKSYQDYTWMADGLKPWHIARLEQYWQALDEEGCASFSKVWA